MYAEKFLSEMETRNTNLELAEVLKSVHVEESVDGEYFEGP